MESISKKISASALRMAMTETRDLEKKMQSDLAKEDILAVAVDFGGELTTGVSKLIERAIVASKRAHLIEGSHLEEGAVAGAAHEAITQIYPKAMGLNIGGKLGIARKEDHISVAVFMGIGMIHLDEVAVGMAHRAI